MTSLPENQVENFEATPRMTATGLYEDFESSFSGLAIAIKGYQDALGVLGAEQGELNIKDFEAFLEQNLAVPAPEYQAFLHARRPEIEAAVFRASDARAVVKIDAAIRTLNMRAQVALRQFQKGIREPAVLAEVMESLNELYAQMGRTDTPF